MISADAPTNHCAAAGALHAIAPAHTPLRTCQTSGVTFPDFKKIADAYSIPYFEINTNEDIAKILENFLSFEGPCICQVFTDPNEIFEPRVVAKMDENGKFIPGRLSEARWS